MTMSECCHHMGYSFLLTARVLLYASSHRQDNTHHSLCYTSCGAPVGTRNSSMGPSHEGSIWRPMAPWANTLTTELHLAPPNLYDATIICFNLIKLELFFVKLKYSKTKWNKFHQNHYLKKKIKLNNNATHPRQSPVFITNRSGM